MVREFAVSVYLIIFSLLFSLFKRYPQKKRSTFVASFGDNILFILKELQKRTNEEIVILKTPSCRIHFEAHTQHPVLRFTFRHPIDWLRSIYYLATSTDIIVDNYYGFFAATSFKPNVRCIQLWHAAGAVKQFGMKDRTNELRSKKAIARFRKVYGQFHHVVVGSEKMAQIFEESFQLPSERMVRTGIPRTDFFFDKEAMQDAVIRVRNKYPFIADKKVLLYAPTYRDDELTEANFMLDMKQLYEALHEEYVFLFRLHPAVRGRVSQPYPHFAHDVSEYGDVNELLTMTDILVTDYSSLPFEFSLLGRPMIFYAYDLEKYERTRGLWEPYKTFAPGPVVKGTKELIRVIQEQSFDLERVASFAREWNEYSTGNASESFVKTFYPRRLD